jgi:hypothetical protein
VCILVNYNSRSQPRLELKTSVTLRFFRREKYSPRFPGVVAEFLLVAIGFGRIFDATTDVSSILYWLEVVMFSVGFRFLRGGLEDSHFVARIQVALSMLGRSFEFVKTSMVGLVDLVVTRVSSLVTGRSWLGLPNKFPFVGGRGSSVQKLGDVSANGLTAGCRSVDAEHVDEIVFEFLR